MTKPLIIYQLTQGDDAMAASNQQHQEEWPCDDEPTKPLSMLRLRELDGAMSSADQDIVLQVAAFEMAQFCVKYERVSKLAPLFDAVRQVELVEPWFRVEVERG